MDNSMPDRVFDFSVSDCSKRNAVTWPFPNKPPEHEPLYKLPFNIENEEDAPI